MTNSAFKEMSSSGLVSKYVFQFQMMYFDQKLLLEPKSSLHCALIFSEEWKFPKSERWAWWGDSLLLSPLCSHFIHEQVTRLQYSWDSWDRNHFVWALRKQHEMKPFYCIPNAEMLAGPSLAAVGTAPGSCSAGGHRRVDTVSQLEITGGCFRHTGRNGSSRKIPQQEPQVLAWLFLLL